jgi:transposase, IS5 family
MQEKMARASKTRASKLAYVSISQMSLEGFETPFSQQLLSSNRWVQLAHQLPWDEIVSSYNLQMKNHETGASHVNGRVVIGALMIKHMCNLSDEETILQIQENMYMQYFIGYSSYSNEAPFDSSLFVEIRKRLGVEQINSINEKIYQAFKQKDKDKTPPPNSPESSPTREEDHKTEEGSVPTHHGRLLVDASACPQDIAYPTDLNMLNDSRVKSEKLIDVLYDKEIHSKIKPRTYRKIARKAYLKTAQKKNKSKREIRKATGQQLRYLMRNIGIIHRLLDAFTHIPLTEKDYKYLLVIQEVYRQQNQMRETNKKNIGHRIVSIHQPHVRPIVRGKARAKTEFGAKMQLSLVDGFSFIDFLCWDAFNEGTLLIPSIEQYKKRHGHYPKEVLADQIYCNRENRRMLKELGIRLLAKPLGRPSAMNKEHVRPGERNPIEGKFGQAKTAYGLDRIKARLSNTSQSWIASIILVLNLVKLARQASIDIIYRFINLILQQLSLNHTCLLIQ